MKPEPKEIRDVKRAREESARQTFAVGRVDPHGVQAQEVETARFCPWCLTFPDGAPEGPYVETTTICEACEDRHFGGTP